METTFSICAAPKLGSIAGTKKVGRVKRPINLTIVAEDADSIMSKGNVITFECKKFDVIKKLSSRNWKNLFDFQHEGKKVTVIVPDNYVCLPVSFMLYLFGQFLSVFSLGIGRILIPFFVSDLFIFMGFVNIKVDNIDKMWEPMVRAFLKFYLVE